MGYPGIIAEELHTFTTGSKTVAASGTAEALSATKILCGGVTIRANDTNTGNVYIGGSTVDKSTNQGVVIPAGATISMAAQAGHVINLANIYIDVDTNGDGVTFDHGPYSTAISTPTGVAPSASLLTELTETGGEKDVTSAGTAERLVASETLCHSVLICAKLTNTNNIYTGPSDIDQATKPYNPLAAGYCQERTAPPGYVIDLNGIWIDADTNGEGVLFTYWGV
jgi:hypothetical protein